MVIHIESVASYIYEPKECSQTVGHYYIMSQPYEPTKDPHHPHPQNGPIHTKCRLLIHFVAYTAKVEVGGPYHNGQTYVTLRITLK